MNFRTMLRLLLCLCIGGSLAACRHSEPIPLGFVAGLSGRVADLGVAGRNGVQLAVEQRNAAGGINGQLINLIVRDDKQNPETVKQVVGELINQNIELIIGPMTSSMAMVVMPQINASNSILLSPTVATSDLVGTDDHFLRVMAETANYGLKSASYLYRKLGIRTVAALYDMDNRAYSESWLKEFRTAFAALGGRVVLARSFQSGNDTVFQPLVQELLAANADSVLIISNAVDSALICQQVRKLAPWQRITMAEWAATERFTQLAGSAAEGVVVAQYIDRNDSSRRYQDFLASYRARFKQDPGFAGLAGYDAALVALKAYSIRKQGESLKQTIIARKSFQGGQQLLNIDRFGDADRRTFVTVVRDNHYVTLE